LRRLIINADDLGLASGVNRGIIESHVQGVVTSATLMACGEKFAQAAAQVAQTPRLSVGCHVVLVDGVPVLDAAAVSTLTVGPKFRDRLTNFAMLAATGRLDPAQIESEVTAQIQKLQAAGIQVSHLDSHKHTHMFPVVLKGMLRAATNCGIRAVRNPFEPLVFATVRHWKRQFQIRLMRRFRASFQAALADAGVVTPDGCVGIAATGGLTQETFESLIRNLPDGTWEFVSHPGYNDAELDKIQTRLRDSREKELGILTSAATKEALQREGIQLISYRDLPLQA
jgi:chitin disaccharide deacetylase